jgi:YHS domain-containing protein
LSEGLLQGVDTSDVAVEKNLPEISDHQTVNQQAQAKVVEAPVPELATSPENLTTADQVVAQTADPVLPSDTAMGGYCPVSLSMAIHASQAGQTAASAWVRGNPEYAVRHRGRVYHCASQELLTKFLEKPDLYAPVLSGCDLVEYSKSGKWIDGDCRFGFIDKETGRIFLFSSSLNCQEFAQNCESYSSMVGKPSEH